MLPGLPGDLDIEIVGPRDLGRPRLMESPVMKKQRYGVNGDNTNATKFGPGH